ncbi:MAG TPA: glycosyltransferase family 4 protein [Candidatus Binataceae bacterium]|jgi:glycosyltransferase involved in cell wall biosynthesis|nr:glycosyltransferase family 4 protein [Candidatus Binataceae bacterium]
MKILLISSSRIVGGAERVTLQLAQALLERGYGVEALCPAGGEWHAAASAARIPVHPAAIGGALNLLTPFLIGRTVSATRPDLLMVITSDEWVWACLRPRRATRPRLILVRHMALPLPFAVRWLAGHRADAIVAVSRSVRQSLLTDSAIAPSMVHLIPNATRFPARQSIPDSGERMRARSLLGLPAAGRWIGFVGGVNLGKGIEDAMLASRHANQSLGDVHLLVCGRKDPRRDIPGCEELARRHGMEQRVHYLGHLDDVTPAIIASDLVVIATHSTLREGLSQTAIDAMACGTPIAGYALGGITDAVGDTDPAAVLACPDDIEDLGHAVTRLLQDAELAARVAQRGLDRARPEFAPALMAGRYEQLFSAFLADRTARGKHEDGGTRD